MWTETGLRPEVQATLDALTEDVCAAYQQIGINYGLEPKEWVLVLTRASEMLLTAPLKLPTRRN